MTKSLALIAAFACLALAACSEEPASDAAPVATPAPVASVESPPTRADAVAELKVVTESYVAAREAYNAARAAVREAKEAGDDAKAELLQAEVYPLRDRYREEAEVFAAARERVKAFDRATETID